MFPGSEVDEVEVTMAAVSSLQALRLHSCSNHKHSVRTGCAFSQCPHHHSKGTSVPTVMVRVTRINLSVRLSVYSPLNTLNAKIFNFHFHPLEFVSR